MHGDIGIAAANPPDSMGTEAGGVEKADLARLRRLRDVEYTYARAERLLGLHGVSERFAVVVGLARILLHGPDVRAVHGEQEVAVDLQMVRSGILRSGNECHRF